MTPEQLSAIQDNVCIICREEMTADQQIKRLPCDHVFHKNCLRSWFQRQQTCPTCRTPILRYNAPPQAPQQPQQAPQQQQQAQARPQQQAAPASPSPSQSAANSQQQIPNPFAANFDFNPSASPLISPFNVMPPFSKSFEI